MVSAPAGRRRATAAAVVLVTALGITIGLQLTKGPSTAGCHPVTLEIVSSTEKSDLLATLADRYNREHRRLGGAQCPTVTVDKLTSGAAEQALAGGWAQSATLTGGLPVPDVWAPTSSMWVALLREQEPDRVAAPAPAGDPYPVIARSAVVVAMPSAKANALTKALTEDGAVFDWSALQLSTNAAGVALNWGTAGTSLRFGDSAWGRFLFRKDNPLDSTSGLAATIATYEAAYSAAEGAPVQGLDLPDRAFRNDAVVRFVRRVEAGIPPSGYSFDGTQMMRDLANDDRRVPGWSDTSAVVVQEQLAYLYNTHSLAGDSPTSKPNQPLVPLYPASGTLMMDHPMW